MRKQRQATVVTNAPATVPNPVAPTGPTGAVIFPSKVDPRYAGETSGQARMHTCVDQYNANKATNANGGMKWIELGGGYYSKCNNRLKGGT